MSKITVAFPIRANLQPGHYDFRQVSKTEVTWEEEDRVMRITALISANTQNTPGRPGQETTLAIRMDRRAATDLARQIDALNRSTG